MEKSLLCPSYFAKSGANLFGIKDANGEVQYLKQTVEIDSTFVEETQKGSQAEGRFRFSGKCIEKGCAQWESESKSCGLAQKLIHTFQKTVEGKVIPDCPIRAECRWYAQEQALACVNCNEIFRNSEIDFIQTT